MPARREFTPASPQYIEEMPPIGMHKVPTDHLLDMPAAPVEQGSEFSDFAVAYKMGEPTYPVSSGETILPAKKAGKIKNLGHYIIGKFIKEPKHTQDYSLNNMAKKPPFPIEPPPQTPEPVSSFNTGAYKELTPWDFSKPSIGTDMVSSPKPSSWNSIKEALDSTPWDFSKSLSIEKAEPLLDTSPITQNSYAVPVKKEKYEASVDAATILERIESQHYVTAAPDFSEQVDDTSRTNTFSFVKRKEILLNNEPGETDTIVTITEHEGLTGLRDFLTGFISRQMKGGEGDSVLANKARGILENLTFIGDKEYREAAHGLGVLWKAYLDEDPNRQLCVLTKISEGYRIRKSDVHLFENILATFTEEELRRYSGRIITDLGQITKKPADTRIVLLDDWTISGSQLRSAYNVIQKSPEFEAYADRVEINLLVASRNRLNIGLLANEYEGQSPRIPVKAYYKAHNAENTSEHVAHVSGTHSSVDYDFEMPIGTMVTQLRSQLPAYRQKSVNMPPLTNIIRTYRYAKPLVTVRHDGTIVRSKV